jgi:hypothetical protein
MGFRFRVSGDKGSDGQIKGQVWAGVDLDGDNAMDMFVGATDTQISFHSAGTGANISPKTTTIDSTPEVPAEAVTSGTNFSYENANSIDDSPLDVDANGGNDYYITFVVSFSTFKAAADSILGTSTFSNSTPITYVVATAKNVNTLNSDLNGVDGRIDSTTTWEDLGSISETMTAAVPEPALIALIIGLVGFAYVLYCRRK